MVLSMPMPTRNAAPPGVQQTRSMTDMDGRPIDPGRTGYGTAGFGIGAWIGGGSGGVGFGMGW